MATRNAKRLGAPARATAPSAVAQVSMNTEPTTTRPSISSTGRARAGWTGAAGTGRPTASAHSAAHPQTGSVR